MIVKDNCSNGLRVWSNVLKIFGVLSIILSIIAWLTGGDNAIAFLLGGGVSLIVLGVLFKGLYPISAMAEKNLAEAGDTEFIYEEKQKQ